MAKLHSYFVLCPLIDQKSFLGVSPDKESNTVVVTLGRNVVNKYKLTDQKQLGGWTSKEHLTAAVLYDLESNKYVGVFNHSTIRLWSDQLDNLDKDKLKKYKFTSNILQLLHRQNHSVLIIFKNGCCYALGHALENRKSLELNSVLKTGETIIEARTYIVKNVEYICYVVKSKEKYEIVTAPLREELGEIDKSKVSRVKIIKPCCTVLGTLISSEEAGLYILWNDAKLQIYDFINKSWRNVGSVPWVSTSVSVSMAWMGEKHLIIFGSDSKEDGAIIVAFNISLGVGSYRYPMKMYTQHAKLYCYFDNLILDASNHLGILPYALETSRSLSSLLATHEVTDDDTAETGTWGNEGPTLVANNELKTLLCKGISERNICHRLIPELISNNDHKSLVRIIEQFDVPENYLVLLIQYGLKCIMLSNTDTLDYGDEDQLEKLFNNKGLDFLNKTIQLSFSDAILIPILKNTLSFNEALLLLSYISYLLDAKSKAMFDVHFERRVLDWCSILIDAFYQELVITKDDKATKVLERAKALVINLLDQLNEINNILPLLNSLLYNKVEKDESNNAYAIEVMRI